MSELAKRDWLQKAAVIWCDMERGLYPWPGKAPRTTQGELRVVKRQILKDLDISNDYHDQKGRIWENPEFLKCLALERRRRDVGIVDVVKEIEEYSGPISGIGNTIVSMVKQRLEDDPDELTTKELLQYGPQWIRLGLELEGKLESAKQQGIEHVLTGLVGNQQITSNMLDQALDLLRQSREMQDQSLAHAGVIEGQLDE